MKALNLLTLIFTLAGSSLFLYGQEKELPPEGGDPKEFKIPEPHVLELDNGMKVVLVNYGLIPKVTLRLYVATGAINEAPDEVGLSDLLADLLKEGTVNYDAKALSKEFAKMGGGLNINAGMHEISLSANVLSEFAPKVVPLFAEILQHPKLPESELERLKSNLKRQFTVARSRPQGEAQRKFNKAIYGDHPYGRMLPGDDLIDSHSIERIRRFFEEQFGAQRSTLFIVGQFREDAVISAVRSGFNNWKAGKAKDYPEAQPNLQAEVELTDRSNSPQSTIRFGFPVPDPSHPDFIALEVMDDFLGGSFSSRITSNIREDKGYTYSPRSTLNNQFKSTIWYQAADVTIEHTGDALLEISREIDRLRNEAPSQEELDGIKNYMAGSFVLQNSSPAGIINQLRYVDFHDLGEHYLSERVHNILAVTPEQIRQAANNYLDPENMFLTVVGDTDQTKPQVDNWKKADKKFKKVVD